MAGLDFEKPIVELEKKIQELKSFVSEKKIDLSSEIKRLEDKLEHLKKDTYANLSAWQKVQLARHLAGQIVDPDVAMSAGDAGRDLHLDDRAVGQEKGYESEQHDHDSLCEIQ